MTRRLEDSTCTHSPGTQLLWGRPHVAASLGAESRILTTNDSALVGLSRAFPLLPSHLPACRSLGLEGPSPKCSHPLTLQSLLSRPPTEAFPAFLAKIAPPILFSLSPLLLYLIYRTCHYLKYPFTHPFPLSQLNINFQRARTLFADELPSWEPGLKNI